MLVPPRLSNSLRCLECRNDTLVQESDHFLCDQCDARYEVENGIPAMMDDVAENQQWNSWDDDEIQEIGQSYYKRAKGELPEKEASKSLARLLERRDLYSSGNSLLDVGCATGHFLRSLRRLLDPDIRYTGIDVNMSYLQWGAEIFGLDDTATFMQCDALDIPVEDDTFDIVFVNLFHFFPRIDEALEEVLRVAEDRVIWRTPIGEINYVVKAIHDDSYDSTGVIEPDREDVDYTLYMMYSEKYLREMFDDFGWELEFIERDTDFETFDNNELDGFDDVAATKVVNDMQINGNIVLDWQYVCIDADSAD